MTETDRLDGVFVESTMNTVFSGLFVLVLVGTAYSGMRTGSYEAVLFSVVAIAIVVGPAAALREPTVMPPWYFLALICLPILWETLAPFSLVTGIIPSLSLATLGLLFVVEIHHFTALRLVPWFAIVLTVLSTLAMASLLSILRWTADMLFGTSFLLDGRTQAEINTAVMVEFVYTTIAGSTRLSPACSPGSFSTITSGGSPIRPTVKRTTRHRPLKRRPLNQRSSASG